MAKVLDIDFSDEVTYNGKTYFPSELQNRGNRVMIQLEEVTDGFYERKALELTEQINRRQEDKLREKERQAADLVRIDEEIASLEAQKTIIQKKNNPK